MKRIYIEMIVAILILAWTVGNIILTGAIFVSCFPIIVGFLYTVCRNISSNNGIGGLNGN